MTRFEPYTAVSNAALLEYVNVKLAAMVYLTSLLYETSEFPTVPVVLVPGLLKTIDFVHRIRQASTQRVVNLGLLPSSSL